MDWYEADVRALELAQASTRVPVRPAVFYGSSSITLWNTLALDLEIPCAVNAGFGGSTLEACVWFFERIVLPLSPSSLVVYAGDNDLGDGRTAQEVVSRFRELQAKVQRELGTIPFGFISIKPSPVRVALLERIICANDAIQAELRQQPHAFYVDVFTPMLGPDGQPRPELFGDDGLHLSGAGYRLWAGILRQYRDRMFTQDCGGGHTARLASEVDAP